MNPPNLTILYVDNPETSQRFYTQLLGSEPIETSPAFVMYALKTGLMLGLWSRHKVTPLPTAQAGGGELAFPMDDDAQVEATFTQWKNAGVTIVLEPKTLEFGHSFLAQDPDGHRLRVFAPPANG